MNKSAPRNRSAGIVIKDSKVLLMRRVKDGEGYWIFPGGGIESGEAPEVTVEREIMEEMGVKVRVDRLLYELTREGGEKDYYFLCEYLSGTPALMPGTNEHEAVQNEGQVYDPKWIDLSEISGLTLYPLEIRDRVVNDFAKTNGDKN